jgi:hypothetical protein
MDWFKTNVIGRVADTASSVKNMVISRLPAVKPLVSESTTQKANVMLGGRREKRGYTCTGGRMRKSRRTRTRRRR